MYLLNYVYRTWYDFFFFFLNFNRFVEFDLYQGKDEESNNGLKYLKKVPRSFHPTDSITYVLITYLLT